jgi:hypothetical protein
MKAYLSGDQSYIVKLGKQSSYKVIPETIVPQNFIDLNDVNIVGLTTSDNNYPVVYNASLGKFVITNPDTVLSAASTTTGPQPGLPGDFVDTVENTITIDGGSF